MKISTNSFAQLLPTQLRTCLLIKAEIGRFNHKSDPEHAFELFVFKQVFTASIVILKEQVLIFPFIKFKTQLGLCIKTHPTASFGQNQGSLKPFVVVAVSCSRLNDAVVAKNIPVVFAVDDR